MARCEVCGNEYHMTFQVIAAGHTHTFDSFECAIHRLAPICEHCGCKIVGHGMEAEGMFYCWSHGGRRSRVIGIRAGASGRPASRSGAAPREARGRGIRSPAPAPRY